MSKKIPYLETLFFVVVILLALASCYQVGPTANQSIQTTISTSIRILTPTIIEQTPSIRISPSSALSTPSIIPSSTLTSTFTWTPASTLSPKDAHALVEGLVENNGGCELPCFWGITPGKTDWNTARYFLDTFIEGIKQDEGVIERNGSLIHWEDYSVMYKTPSGDMGNFGVYVENGVVMVILTNGQSFRLARLLTMNGKPDEVYISAHRYTNTGDPPPFYFLIYYGRNNFWAQYDLEGKVVGNIIKGCPQSIDAIRVWLGSPERKRTLEDLFDYVFGPPYSGFPRYPVLSLWEATGMDLETFTNIFKDSNNQRCIETPADLWN